MRRTDLPYIGGFCSAAFYAIRLERRPKKYHPDVTINNVTKGIVLTGAWVAVRALMGAPTRAEDPLMAWAWWAAASERDRGARWLWLVTVQMFCATGAAMYAMELWQWWQRRGSLARYTGGRRAEGPPAGI